MHDALPKNLPVQTLVAMNALVIPCLNGSTNTYGLFRETLLAIVAGECRPDRKQWISSMWVARMIY